MEKKLNILHLESSPGWGGQEIRILKESIAMRNLGHNIVIAVEKNGQLYTKTKKEKFISYEVRFKKIYWLISFFYLLYIMLKHKIDIINTHSSSDAWLAGIIAKLLRIKIIRTRHLSTPIKKGLNSKLLYGYLADFVVTTSQDAADIIIKQSSKNEKNCMSIPTGVDLQKVVVKPKEAKIFREKLQINEEIFLVGSACFMRSWKGIQDLLKAAKILENEKNIKFIIIGGGHSKTYIDMAKNMNLKNIVFTSHLENPYPALLSLDVFTLLSTAHEGISQASLQAAYLQKPLITTPTGGLKEVCIDNYTGILVPVFSSAKIAEAILKLKKNKKLREKFAKNARKLSLNFSQDMMINKMNQIYKNLY